MSRFAAPGYETPASFPQQGARAALYLAVRLCAAVARWRRIARDLDHLDRLDDRMLRDIGVGRDDLRITITTGRPPGAGAADAIIGRRTS